jgi:hypothetical protein
MNNMNLQSKSFRKFLSSCCFGESEQKLETEGKNFRSKKNPVVVNLDKTRRSDTRFRKSLF